MNSGIGFLLNDISASKQSKEYDPCSFKRDDDRGQNSNPMYYLNKEARKKLDMEDNLEALKYKVQKASE